MARGHPGAGGAPSELVDGRQDQRRQRHHDEQGPRDHRGASPVRDARGRDRGPGPPAVDRAQPGRLHATARCWRSSARRTCASRSPALWAGRRGSPPAPRSSTCAPIRAWSSSRPTPSASRPCGWPALALRQGGAAPTILNAANEVAVAAFLDRSDRLSRHRPHRRRRCWSGWPASRVMISKPLSPTMRRLDVSQPGCWPRPAPARHPEGSQTSMIATIAPICDPVPARPVGRRVRARVRALLGRPAQRRADRGVLDRLRARAVRPQRPARHPLEVQRGPARRLCEDAGRRRRDQRHR